VQVASVTQTAQRPSLLHSGAAAPQSELALHWTQSWVDVLQIGRVGSVQSGFAAHAKWHL